MQHLQMFADKQATCVHFVVDTYNTSKQLLKTWRPKLEINISYWMAKCRNKEYFDRPL